MAHVLLVNISGESGDGIPALLRQIGCDVVLADDAEEVVGLATDGGWDLIMLDAGKLDQKCLEICQRVKEVMTTAPLVVLSTADSDESLVIGLSTGVDDIIIKPVATAVLIARINAMLRRAKWLQLQKEITMEQANRFDWAEMEGLTREDRIMLTCSFALQEKGKRDEPPYEMFQVPGGAYLVRTPKGAGVKNINLILSD